MQELRKSQAVLLIRQALMLPSVLIKVKSRDVTGQEGDAGGSPRPRRAPPLHKSAAGGRAAAPAAVPGREENRFEELEDVRPRRYTPKYTSISHPKIHLNTRTQKNTPKNVRQGVKGSGTAGADGKLR